MKISQHDAAMDDFDIQRERAFSGAGRIVLICSLLFLILGIWAWFGRLDEVSTGNGKVIPSSREQVLQSLDGGILAQLTVRKATEFRLTRLSPGLIRRVWRPMWVKVRQNIALHSPPAHG